MLEAVKADDLEQLVDSLGGLLLGPLADGEPKRHVVPHGHVPKGRIVLEDEPDPALLRREVEPVLHEVGTEQEQAAATLGANTWQTFWRITLPAIRWGLTYGVVLTVARALGEFGAVIMVSSGFPGVSQTLTLLVHSRYIDDHNTYGAYAAATLLMGLAVVVLLFMTLLDRKRSAR